MVSNWSIDVTLAKPGFAKKERLFALISGPKAGKNMLGIAQ